MDSKNLSFKDVLCSDPMANELNDESVKGGAGGDAGVEFIPSVLPSPMNDSHSSEAMRTIDVAGFMSKLAYVNKNILKLKEQSLFAFVTGKPMEMSKLIDKLKTDWTILHGDFHFFPKGNGWVEIRFANPADKRRIWEGRPFHVFSQLLLPRPWKASFDPFLEFTCKLDLWIRIMHLPAEYISADVLKTIIEMNHVGEFVKLDAFTAHGVNVCYPRLCISAEKDVLMNRKVMVPNEEGHPQFFQVWNEEFSPGCGFCGAADHDFDHCALQILHKKANEKIAIKTRGFKNEFSGKGKEKYPGNEGWTKVAKKNKWKHGVSVINAGGSLSAAMTGTDQIAPHDDLRMEACCFPPLSPMPAMNSAPTRTIRLIDYLGLLDEPDFNEELHPPQMLLMPPTLLPDRGVIGPGRAASSCTSFQERRGGNYGHGHLRSEGEWI